LGYREVEPPIQLSVFTGGLNSKLSIQLNFSCSSAMVLTAYTCMVVGQKEIEARVNIPDGALLGLEILVLVKTKQSILDVM